MDTILKDDERIDFVNDNISLIQKSGGLTFGTDALLLAGYINGRYSLGLELGGGSGIISMLVLTRGKVKSCFCAEIQEEYADLIKRNAALSNLSDRLFPLNSDIRNLRLEKQADVVFSNPPYMKTNSGARNLLDKKNIARHEVNGTISDFCLSASKNLRFGGSFVIVYRTDRISELFSALSLANLEPKRMTHVHANINSRPSMLLLEARLGGKCGMTVTKPLIIYSDESNKEYSADMNYIMENGSFPIDFQIK